MLVYVISKILPGIILILFFPVLLSYPILPYSAFVFAVISITGFSLRSLTFDTVEVIQNALHD